MCARHTDVGVPWQLSDLLINNLTLRQMAKKRRRPTNCPETTSIDVLGNVSDDELCSRHMMLEQGLNGAHSDDAVLWETELAYVRREQIMRSQRRDAHSTYVRSGDNRPESMLPEPDMDNSTYVNAYMERLERWGIV